MRTIGLTKGKICLVDDDVFEEVSKHKWYFHVTSKAGRGYAARREKLTKKFIYMHRIITNAQRGLDVDHINNDTLDNRRSNLRVCTRKENLRNSLKNKDYKYSKYRGVTKIGKKYWAVFMGGVKRYVGIYNSEVEAALAYNKEATKRYGEYAKLNEV